MNEPTTHFTLVFKGDIRKFKKNPFTTETPYGIASSAAVGDRLEKCDLLSELLLQAIDTRAPDYIETDYPGWTDRVKKAIGREGP